MSTHAGDVGSNGTARPARPGDAAAIADLQIDTWRLIYGGVLPTSMLAALDKAAATQAWSEAILTPPTRRHHVLVALDTATDTVVGFAALTPAGDEDADPEHDAELVLLVVDPAHARLGHGSRLLAASVDILRAEGVTRAQAWLLAQDDALRGLLTSAGWGADGSHRTLESDDGSEPVRQLRLHTDLSEPTQLGLTPT